MSVIVFAPIALVFITAASIHATITYNLNVQIVRVFDDSGGDGAPLNSPSRGSYLYESGVNEIWEQAGIQVTFRPTVSWNNTEAQRLDFNERNAIYSDTFSTTSGAPLPELSIDTFQVFFV